MATVEWIGKTLSENCGSMFFCKQISFSLFTKIATRHQPASWHLSEKPESKGGSLNQAQAYNFYDDDGVSDDDNVVFDVASATVVVKSR